MDPWNLGQKLYDYVDNTVKHMNFLGSVAAYVAIAGVFSWYGMRMALSAIKYILN